MSTTPGWGNPAKCLSQRHNKSTCWLVFQTVPLMLSVKEGSCEYQLSSHWLAKLGNRYLKNSAAAATAFSPKKQRRCCLPLLVYESSAATAAASKCKRAGAAARRCRYFKEKKKSKAQRHFNIVGLLVKLQLC